MRIPLRSVLASTLVASLFAVGPFLVASNAGAVQPSISHGSSGLTAHLTNAAPIYRAQTTDVCSAKVPAGVAHCSAVVQRNSVNPHKQFTALTSAAQALGDNGAYSPAFLQSAYNVQSAPNNQVAGSRQIVAVIGAFNDPKLVGDLAVYRQHFGLSACPTGTVSPRNSSCVVEVVNESGTTALHSSNNDSWALEASIDTQMVSALCPNCQILFVEANTATMVDLGASVNTAIRLGATVVTNSYGSVEYAGEAAVASRDFSHKGVPVVVAAGEGGTRVEFPASAPDVVAVGGTSLVQNNAGGERDGYETAWGATDSGCSKYEAKPAWQHDTGCAKRSVADIAAVADPATGVWIYDSDHASGSMIAGGTSVAAPIVASLFALAGNHHSTNVYPVSFLYQHRNALYSVTSGSSTDCSTYLCNATRSHVGYNGLTGLGTPGGTPNSFSAFGAVNRPTTPVLSSANAGDGSVTLTWSASNAKGEQASLGYEIHQGTTGDLTTQLVNDGLSAATTLTVSGLDDGTTYFFSVEAITNGGFSNLSNVASATPVAESGEPGAPSAVAVDIIDGQVTVSWVTPLDEGASAISDYTVTDNEGDVCTTPEVTTGNESCTFVGVVNSSADTFYVTAANAQGTSVAGTSSGTSGATSSPNAW